MPTTNEELLDRAVSHQINLLRLSGAVRDKLIANLNRVEDDLIRQIRDRADRGSFTERRLNLILRDVREILNDARPETLDIVRAELAELAAYEADFGIRMLRGSTPVELDIKRPTAEQLRAVVTSRPFQGKILREWVSELTDSQRRQIRDAIRIAFTEGETIDQIVRRIRGTRAMGFRDGVMEVSRRHAAALVRTAVNHTATRAREHLYEANRDIVKGVRWVSTLDSRTTEICMDRDGQVYPVDSGPRPPAHPNCRSTTAPVVKSWRELGIDLDEAPPGTRAAMDGQVPDKLTYGEWLRRQPAAVQDDALGQTKGRLFRQGNLSVDRFVDQRGRAYTLDELRRREGRAFERTGL